VIRAFEAIVSAPVVTVNDDGKVIGERASGKSPIGSGIAGSTRAS
jgi:hypothetical protein